MNAYNLLQKFITPHPSFNGDGKVRMELKTSCGETDGKYQKGTCEFIFNGESYFRQDFEYRLGSDNDKETQESSAWERLLWSMLLDAVLYRPQIRKLVWEDMVAIGHPLAKVSDTQISVE